MRRMLLILAVGSVASGCGGGEERAARTPSGQTPAPGGRPPIQSAPFAGQPEESGPTDGHTLPVRLVGINSVEEMEAGKRSSAGAEAAALYETGFRKAFTADRARRDYPGARVALERAVALDPAFAHAHRALGYAAFNLGDTPAAFLHYGKAIELRPDYGEAHYALAFMYAMIDRRRGAEAYRRAMELGVPDERHLGERFYPEE